MVRAGKHGELVTGETAEVSRHTAAKQVVHDGMRAAVGGGLESVSLVQNDKMNRYRTRDPWLEEHVPQLYMAMLETAEVVADRYGVSREQQDE